MLAFIGSQPSSDISPLWFATIPASKSSSSAKYCRSYVMAYPVLASGAKDGRGFSRRFVNSAVPASTPAAISSGAARQIASFQRGCRAGGASGRCSATAGHRSTPAGCRPPVSFSCKYASSRSYFIVLTLLQSLRQLLFGAVVACAQIGGGPSVNARQCGVIQPVQHTL